MKTANKILALLILSVSLICNCFSVFSQPDTTKIKIIENKICFDVTTAQKIAKELVLYDGLKKENALLNQQINIQQNRLSEKDSINFLLNKKNNLVEKQLFNSQNQLTISNMQYETLTNEFNYLNKLYQRKKIKNTFVQILLISIASYFILKK